MVLGYLCETHGYQRECDVDDIGQRICRECGMAVTGLVGRSRSTRSSPPIDESSFTSGHIEWTIKTDHTEPGFHVSAFDHEDAIERAIEIVDHPQSIREIEPTERSYGRM